MSYDKLSLINRFVLKQLKLSTRCKLQKFYDSINRVQIILTNESPATTIEYFDMSIVQNLWRPGGNIRNLRRTYLKILNEKDIRSKTISITGVRIRQLQDTIGQVVHAKQFDISYGRVTKYHFRGYKFDFKRRNNREFISFLFVIWTLYKGGINTLSYFDI
jgi:hypothetical protein